MMEERWAGVIAEVSSEDNRDDREDAVGAEVEAGVEAVSAVRGAGEAVAEVSGMGFGVLRAEGVGAAVVSEVLSGAAGAAAVAMSCAKAERPSRGRRREREENDA